MIIAHLKTGGWGVLKGRWAGMFFQLVGLQTGLLNVAEKPFFFGVGSIHDPTLSHIKSSVRNGMKSGDLAPKMGPRFQKGKKWD